jgi:uncharacterized membrane protein
MLSSSPSIRMKRYAFIDWLRGWAMIIMIEVHVFNSMLVPDLKKTGWFAILNFINGLVAPAFLFISGFTFLIRNLNKRDELIKFGKFFWKQVFRILTVLGVGYVLRIPSVSLNYFWHKTTAEEWKRFIVVDVLHCIAMGLLMLLLIRLLCKNESVLKIVILSTAMLFIIPAFLIWSAHPEKVMPAAIAAYFNINLNSIFPIFPWVGFMLMGAFCAFSFIQSKKDDTVNQWARRIGVIGIIVIIVNFILFMLLSPIVPFLAQRQTNWFFIGLRLGIIMVLTLFGYTIAERPHFFNRIVNIAGRESLLVYWLHLVILFWSIIGGKSLVVMVQQRYGPWQCALVSAGLIIAMLIAAIVWNWIKSLHPKAGFRAVAVLWIVFFICFFLN